MQMLKHMALGLAILAAPVAVNAAPLTGSIDFGGLFRGTDASGNNVRLVDAAAIDFCANITGPCVTGAGGSFRVDQTNPSGNMPVSAGDTGAIQDFNFASFAGPIADFFTVGGVSFDLNSINTTQFSTPPAAEGAYETDYLLINGVGTLRAAGFDPTSGTFTFSGQTDGVNLVGTFTFSGGSAALPGQVPVPAPAGLALLGAGLLGLGFVRRKAA
ncbi:PEP-CTERM sorting domain-containing protein [Sabulicella glaciei]|uniref:PEP-CTERM sorting domain-containing protein n=1 Tax=Sabulicella glaciei TaxID=2984948 RepID=A0ABT3NRC9_9PROT|nr:PEP-CTERM sorting domain-containing protein [Roseococcus sp. MDT2-1-1]MCW8084716.1 PEP-CTERM sorting domain-containing protein [Roseococcus sp. MDT2-1-1]